MCGADEVEFKVSGNVRGSPPRVRSRLQRSDHRDGPAGITSACAEQTAIHLLEPLFLWDHLRVCGADDPNAEYLGADNGSPPRVRSRQPAGVSCGPNQGITSACAEQTRPGRRRLVSRRDHLRVCGADFNMPFSVAFHAGSPPRVRSRRRRSASSRPGRRITSACAEQTTADAMVVNPSEDHLRVCGADWE